jgi:hypothetical protein
MFLVEVGVVAVDTAEVEVVVVGEAAPLSLLSFFWGQLLQLKI